MHPDADAFLDAIFDAPHDDLPRLAYADWLEEHGQANYAQFIRLQCAAARETPFSPAANDLWEGIGRAWRGLERDWRDLLLGRDRLDATDFERGFLREPLVVGLGEFLWVAPCWEPAGVFTRVCIDAEVDYPVREVCGSGLVPRGLRELVVRNVDVEVAAAMGNILAAPMPRLRVLDLSWCYLLPDQWETLACNPGLSALRALRLDAGSGNQSVKATLAKRFGPALQWVKFDDGPG